MNPELLKLLNPRGVQLTDTGGSVPLITSDDINAACSGADPIGLDVLLIKVCNDRQAQRRAFYSLYQEVIQLAVDQRWKIRERGEEKLRSLTQLVIFELTNKPRCPKCNGTKYTRNFKPCKVCGGTGFYKIKESQRAKALNVAPSTWARVWAYRYGEVLSLITTHEVDALKSISEKLK